MMKIENNTVFIGMNTSYERSAVVLVGAPFDGTTSYRPGARFAPDQIRIDSYGLETYSPYMKKDLEDFPIGDMGNISLPYGNTIKALEQIKATITTLLQDNKIPLLLGGEHLVTLPAIEVLINKYPDLHILHFDAHTDLRDHYLGERLSHATVIRRVHDLLGDGRIFQFGIRSGTREEFEWAKTHTYLQPFDLTTLKSVIDKLVQKPVYLTIDLDILDPSIFSGTGTPEPGGITMNELLNALISLRPLSLVGADIVELSPHYDTSGVSTAVACKVTREVALLLTKGII
ncbi:MAG: agmatinase [Epulopiscium sp.]|nr:agmatinase [Candidatus Epulonipiscium sp.]